MRHRLRSSWTSNVEAREQVARPASPDRVHESRCQTRETRRLGAGPAPEGGILPPCFHAPRFMLLVRSPSGDTRLVLAPAPPPPPPRPRRPGPTSCSAASCPEALSTSASFHIGTPSFPPRGATRHRLLPPTTGRRNEARAGLIPIRSPPRGQDVTPTRQWKLASIARQIVTAPCSRSPRTHAPSHHKNTRSSSPPCSSRVTRPPVRGQNAAAREEPPSTQQKRSGAEHESGEREDEDGEADVPGHCSYLSLDVGAGVEEETAGGEVRLGGGPVEQGDVLRAAGGGVGARVEQGADGACVAAFGCDEDVYVERCGEGLRKGQIGRFGGITCTSRGAASFFRSILVVVV
ncbi:hypothetical protein C8R45DRAFT_1079795 [Mycena sanguinolenta]|nr:hypothetical protein C8R45DRAFT_1079795 [Mycena sanguinolenta]